MRAGSSPIRGLEEALANSTAFGLLAGAAFISRSRGRGGATPRGRSGGRVRGFRSVVEGLCDEAAHSLVGRLAHGPGAAAEREYQTGEQEELSEHDLCPQVNVTLAIKGNDRLPESPRSGRIGRRPGGVAEYHQFH